MTHPEFVKGLRESTRIAEQLGGLARPDEIIRAISFAADRLTKHETSFEQPMDLSETAKKAVDAAFARASDLLFPPQAIQGETFLDYQADRLAETVSEEPDEATAMLREIVDDLSFCPICEKDRDGTKDAWLQHTPDCRLAAILALRENGREGQ